MTPEQLNAWIAVGAILVNVAVESAATIAAFFRRQGLSEDEIHQILAGVKDDAVRRKAISDAIVAAG